MVNVNLNQMQPSASASASALTSSMTKNKTNQTKTRSRLLNRSTIIGIIFLLIICDIIFNSNINTNTNTNTNSKATSTSTTSTVDRGREDSTTTTTTSSTTSSTTTTTTSPKTVLQQVRFVFIVSIRDRSSSHKVLEELGIGSPIHQQLLNLKLPPPVLSSSSSSSSSSLIQKKNQNQNPQESESNKSLYRIINQSFQFLFSIGSSSRLNLKKGKKGKKGKKSKLKDNNLWKLYEDSYQELIIGLKTFSDSYSSSRSQHQLVSLQNEKENNNKDESESSSSSSSSSSSFIDIPLNVFIPTRSPRTATSTSSSTTSTNTSTSLLLTSQSYMESNDYHLSYPFGLNVRQWNEYPNLDLYYNICTAANVSCGHIYLHNSNTNSKSNPHTISSHSSHNTGYNSQQNGIEDVVSQFLKSSSADDDEEGKESAHSQNYKYDHFSKQQQTQQQHDHDHDDDQLLYYNYKFYHGYYQIIEMQLQKHSLKLIDCLDISTIMNMKIMSDSTNKKMNTDKNMNMLWIETVRNLFGFDTTKNLMNHLENYFFNSNSNNKNNNNNNNNNDSTTPKPTSVTNFFSDIVEETYLRTLRTCPQQLLQQKGHRSPPPADNANDANDSSSSSSSNDNTNGNTTTDEIIIQNEEFNSPLKYFLVIGIEGTGHHFLTGLFSGAPFAIQNSHSNISTQVVVESKYIHKNFKRKAMSLAQLDSAINSFQYNQIFHSFVELFQRENEIVKKDLLRIQQQPQQQQPIQQQQQQLQYRTMPLNCNMNRMGMASYPVGFDTNIAATKKYNNPNLNKNKLGEVRSMVYPTIDLIYKACNEAKVDCGHLYLYRPPDQVLQSTISNRHYHNSILEAIQLYTTFLQRIESDLRNYSHRNWGCIGLYDDDLVDALSAFDNKDIYSNSSSTSQSTTATNYPLWFNITPALLGFDNPTEWARYMKSKLKPTTSTESTQKQRKGGKFQQKLNDEYQHLQIYKIFVEQHHRTIQACKENIVPIA